MRPRPRRSPAGSRIILSCPADFEHRLRLEPGGPPGRHPVSGRRPVGHGRLAPGQRRPDDPLPRLRLSGAAAVRDALPGRRRDRRRRWATSPRWRRSRSSAAPDGQCGARCSSSTASGARSRRIRLSRRPGCPVCDAAAAGHRSEDQHLIVLDQHPRRVIADRPQMLAGNRQHGLGDDPVRVGRVALSAEDVERVVDRRAGAIARGRSVK